MPMSPPSTERVPTANESARWANDRRYGSKRKGGGLEGAAGERFPKIQILTIAEIFGGKKLQFPRHVLATFKQAERKSKAKEEQVGLF